jgi:hypothetical protein
MDVVLDGGNLDAMQAGDFLVRKSLLEQRYDLTLPRREVVGRWTPLAQPGQVGKTINHRGGHLGCPVGRHHRRANPKS